MIRLGKGKPGICTAEGDSHHPGPSTHYANDFFWVSLDDYSKIRRFQEFDMNPDTNTITWELIGKSAWKRELDNLIAMAGGSQLWQRNFFDRSLVNHVRHVVVLGEPYQFVRWSWFDANVKYHLYRALSWLKNRRSCE